MLLLLFSASYELVMNSFIMIKLLVNYNLLGDY